MIDITVQTLEQTPEQIIEAKLRHFLEIDLAVNKEDIYLDSDLENDLGVDSLDRAQLELFCEQSFNIKFSGDGLAKATDLQKVITSVLAKAPQFRS